MPLRPLRPCRHHGCPETSRTGWCAQHAGEGKQREAERQARVNARRPEEQKLYNPQSWKRLRLAYLMEHPLCERCGTLATLVHHRQEHHGDRELFNAWANLEALCVKCHGLATQEQRRVA